MSGARSSIAWLIWGMISFHGTNTPTWPFCRRSRCLWQSCWQATPPRATREDSRTGRYHSCPNREQKLNWAQYFEAKCRCALFELCCFRHASSNHPLYRGSSEQSQRGLRRFHWRPALRHALCYPIRKNRRRSPFCHLRYFPQQLPDFHWMLL